ncbi:MAG: ABC transporter ATP-binding protein [Bdellovibrionales bacterium]|nr:ABC transporter ATP-binding protein [Bdellovibrionales bacterium]
MKKSGTGARLLKISLEHPRALVLSTFFLGLATATQLAEPWVLGRFIDEALGPKNIERLYFYLIAMGCLFVLRWVSAILEAYFMESLGQSVSQTLRTRVFDHFLSLPQNFYDKSSAGRWITRVTNDISSIQEMYSSGIVTFLSNLLVVLGTVVLLFQIHPRAAAGVLLVLLPVIALSVFFSRWLEEAYRSERSLLSQLNSFLAENIQGIRVLQLFEKTSEQLKRFNSLNEGHAAARIATTRTYAFFQPLLTLASGISLGLFMVLGAKAVFNRDLEVGPWVSFSTYTLMLFQPLKELADRWNTFLSAAASAERVFEVFEDRPEPGRLFSDRPLPGARRIQGEVIFDRVGFQYASGRPVLSDVTARIEPGQRIGLVGATGAGKTTLISLLLRLYEITSGRIFMDGREVREWDRAELRKNIGLVQQDVFLFSGQISDNWILDDEVRAQRIRDRQVSQVKSPLDRLLQETGWDLARDLSRPVNERGTNLSQGERQLVAFVRAALGDPGLWILDEATANIDLETETLLHHALKDLGQGQTQILIAHRLSTIEDCDQIWVMHQGRLVESGAHRVLQQSGGIYSKLLALDRAAYS